ncbi:inclusion body family protein [Burkholderia dolosa]|uniref:inclusion body family protein n=1 Tax=Burkholderia dolosa TaxID=152500 RepID=UPI001C988FB3|nr:inclusion body family protein [Burkholderia dolosa]MBY4829493.1 inclusion body family protein [Burkholderia dolosa]
MSSSQQINVMVVIDTDQALMDLKNRVSTDPNNPISLGHDCEYMIVTGSRGNVTGQGSWNLGFSANVGDTVCFRGRSVYDNSDAAIVIYNIVPLGGQPQVFNPFHPEVVQRSGAAMPDANTENGIPATHQPASFTSLSATVRNKGTEAYRVYFGLYLLDDKGETQNLKSYCCWDPTVTVA